MINYDVMTQTEFCAQYSDEPETQWTARYVYIELHTGPGGKCAERYQAAQAMQRLLERWKKP